MKLMVKQSPNDMTIQSGKQRILHTSPTKQKMWDIKQGCEWKGGQKHGSINLHPKVNATRRLFSKRAVSALGSAGISGSSSVTSLNKTTLRMSQSLRRIH
jgi:hypothetical protein